MVNLTNFILQLICICCAVMHLNFAYTLLGCLKRNFTAIGEFQVCTNTTTLAEEERLWS